VPIGLDDKTPKMNGGLQGVYRGRFSALLGFIWLAAIEAGRRKKPPLEVD
jgi:hypothetical protein